MMTTRNTWRPAGKNIPTVERPSRWPDRLAAVSKMVDALLPWLVIAALLAVCYTGKLWIPRLQKMIGGEATMLLLGVPAGLAVMWGCCWFWWRVIRGAGVLAVRGWDGIVRDARGR